MEKIFLEITGRTEDHLQWSDELSSKIHKSTLKPLLGLKGEAEKDGFDLKIASGFRSFSRQEDIWNKKMTGKKPILDENNSVIDYKKISPEELIFFILKWSAIPGTSRHHWGTDLDFFDGNVLNHQLQLIPEEYLNGGVFNPLYTWLVENAPKHGFYFPYINLLGGVGPEPWHLSYFPQANVYQKKFSFDYFLENLRVSKFEGKEILFRESAFILKISSKIHPFIIRLLKVFLH